MHKNDCTNAHQLDSTNASPPRMHKPNATSILKNCSYSKNDSEMGKKAFHQFVELVETNSLIYNTLHFDQYSRLAFRFNIFRFSTNSKFE